MTYTLYISSIPKRRIIAESLKKALSKVKEMTNPETMRSCIGAYQWIGEVPYELICDENENVSIVK